MNVAKYQKAKKELEDLREEALKAKTRISVLTDNLKKRFNLKSLKDASKVKKSLQKKINDLQKKLDSKLEKFEKEWNEFNEIQEES